MTRVRKGRLNEDDLDCRHARCLVHAGFGIHFYRDVGPDNGNKVTCEQAQADSRNGMTKLDRDHDGYACDRQCGD